PELRLRLARGYSNQSPTDLFVSLQILPMFHFTEKRIEAHVCICFVTTLKIKLPVSGETLTKTMIITQKHKSKK
ncbi:MAG: hypothetical protein LBS69_05685, partial [Prevotellaceae bacterium]|nr:hypothetical protein [Prevotellaceae bacterium]